MTPAPLSKVIGVVADISKYDALRNRPQILDKINGIVSMLYRTPALRNLYFQHKSCTNTVAFVEKCNSIDLPFLGIVMPPNVKNVREIRINNTFFELTSQRVHPSCQWLINSRRNYEIDRPKAERLPARILERDIPCGDNRMVSFRSTDDTDCGKLVGVSYINLNGDEVREDVVLSTSTSGTSQSVLEFLEITFPERSGWIEVTTQMGAFLGKYHPSIYAPVHDWFRLEIGCRGMKAEYRGMIEPGAYVFDTDLVPFSDKTLWRLAYKAYEHLDSMELTAEQISGLGRIYGQLSAVTSEDMSAARGTDFTIRLLPEAGKRMLATGKMFSQQ